MTDPFPRVTLVSDSGTCHPELQQKLRHFNFGGGGKGASIHIMLRYNLVISQLCLETRNSLTLPLDRFFLLWQSCALQFSLLARLILKNLEFA